MLALFPAMNYKPWYAIGEFVDNAIQSWTARKSEIEGEFGSAPLRIDIDFDEARGTITITDNAAGIYTADITRAFTPASPPADTSGLSQFGIGMKSAASWYAQRFTVSTSALGEPVRRMVEFDVPAIVESDAATIPLITTEARTTDHGTTLTLSDLNHAIPTRRTLGKVRDYLRSIYRTFISDPDVHIFVKGQELTYEAPDLLRAPRWDDPDGPEVEWRREFELTLPSGTPIHGWAGLLAKGKASRAGFAMLYRGKVVKGAGGAANDAEDGYKPYTIFGAANSFESQRLIGELDISGVPVTHTKDAPLWQGDDEEALINLLAEELDRDPLPLLRMARNHRVTERGRSVQQKVSTAIDSIARTVTSKEWTDDAAHRGAAESQVHPSERSEPVEREVQLGESMHDLAGEQVLLRVIDEPALAQDWIRVTRDKTIWNIEINRSHRFMQSFANLPNMDIEPVLRLGIAFALVQTKAVQSGALEGYLITRWVNELVGGPLSVRIEL